MIPDKSEASIKDGTWFIHSDEINKIQVWGSNLTGKEKVFLNNELVSEERSMKMQNSHKFKDKNGHNYEVKIEAGSLLNGEIICELRRDNTILRIFKTRYLKGKNSTLKRFLIIIFASAVFGVLSSIFELSDLTFFIFLALVLIIDFATRNKGEIIIEEE